MADVFVSYSRRDVAFAHVLVDSLEAGRSLTRAEWALYMPSAEPFQPACPYIYFCVIVWAVALPIQ
jgi:hypothetical protein